MDTLAYWPKPASVYRTDQTLSCGREGIDLATLRQKMFYRALANKCWTITFDRWRHKIWRGDCSLKIKLFAWLMFENKLLMWSNLQSRRWVGPGRCILCKSHTESVAHVFINYTFFRSVWQLISPALLPGSIWAGPNVPSCSELDKGYLEPCTDAYFPLLASMEDKKRGHFRG